MTNLTDAQKTFLETQRAAAMITPADDGMPRAVRVGVVLVDGKLWSSGTQDRIRTARLRRDPRCTLFVFNSSYNFLTLETHVSLLEGSDVPELSVRLFRQMQNRPEGNLSWFGKEMNPEDFMRTMAEEKRLIYEFEIKRAYGMV
jgi:Pyridoxamine 5'-phosphate oxidase